MGNQVPLSTSWMHIAVFKAHTVTVACCSAERSAALAPRMMGVRIGMVRPSRRDIHPVLHAWQTRPDREVKGRADHVLMTSCSLLTSWRPSSLPSPAALRSHRGITSSPLIGPVLPQKAQVRGIG